MVTQRRIEIGQSSLKMERDITDSHPFACIGRPLAPLFLSFEVLCHMYIIIIYFVIHSSG